MFSSCDSATANTPRAARPMLTAHAATVRVHRRAAGPVPTTGCSFTERPNQKLNVKRPSHPACCCARGVAAAECQQQRTAQRSRVDPPFPKTQHVPLATLCPSGPISFHVESIMQGGPTKLPPARRRSEEKEGTLRTTAFELLVQPQF